MDSAKLQWPRFPLRALRVVTCCLIILFGVTVRRLPCIVQHFGADQAKLKTYCDIGKLQDQMEQAEQKKDTMTIAALGAKADNLGKQLGPDYEKVMAGQSKSTQVPRKENAIPLCFSLCSSSADSLRIGKCLWLCGYSVLHVNAIDIGRRLWDTFQRVGK